MTPTQSNELKMQFENLNTFKNGTELVQLARAQYSTISDQLQEISRSSESSLEQDTAEESLHYYREKLIELVTKSHSVSSADVIDKLGFLEQVCEMESCFDEHYHEGQLFKALVRDAPLMLQ